MPPTSRATPIVMATILPARAHPSRAAEDSDGRDARHRERVHERVDEEIRIGS